jgi:ABC-type amino acid transport system permease subunit
MCKAIIGYIGIGFVELTRSGQLMTSATFQPMIVYPIVDAL